MNSRIVNFQSSLAETGTGGMGLDSTYEASMVERITEALKTIYDPEIPINIYDLGLIYSIDLNEDGYVAVRMTLTAPGCPVAGQLVSQVDQATRGVAGVSDVNVELVWDPPWTQDRMTDEAKLELGLL